MIKIKLLNKSNLQESLKKDIERYKIASAIYDWCIKCIEDYPKSPLDIISSGDGNLHMIWFQIMKNYYNEFDSVKQYFRNIGVSQLMISLRDRSSTNSTAGASYAGQNSEHNTDTIYITVNCTLDSSYSAEQDILNVFLAKKTSFIHEFAHMIDDVVLIGPELFRNTNKIYNVNVGEDGQVIYDKKYFNQGLELNARWSEVLHELASSGLPYRPYYREDTEHFEYDWLPLAKKAIRFNELSLQKQRKFINKLFDYFLKGPYLPPERQIKKEGEKLAYEYKDFLRQLSSQYNYSFKEYTYNSLVYMADFDYWYENIYSDDRGCIKERYTENVVKEIIYKGLVVIRDDTYYRNFYVALSKNKDKYKKED